MKPEGSYTVERHARGIVVRSETGFPLEDMSALGRVWDKQLGLSKRKRVRRLGVTL